MGLKPTYVKAAFEYAYDELKRENVQDKVTLFYNDYDTYFSVDDELALISYINEGEEAKICGGIVCRATWILSVRLSKSMEMH